MVAGTPPAYAPGSPPLLDRVRTAMRTRHMSRRTEQAYVFWVRRYILFHDKRHPGALGAEEVSRFLSHLAEERRVSASTQNQALSALLLTQGAWSANLTPRSCSLKLSVRLHGDRASTARTKSAFASVYASRSVRKATARRRLSAAYSAAASG